MSEAVPPVEVVQVEKTFPGGVRALAGVSFQLGASDRTCLLGPNGAGKTTLIRLLSGALSPTKGRVSLFGEPVDSARYLQAKQRVGIVPQSPGMYRDLTVSEYLHFVRDVYGRGDLPGVISALDLRAFVDRKMTELSGGTQRRLSIAAALLPDPELLLLDEPTAGLDPIVRREVHALLGEVMRKRAVLLCTHDLAEAEALCERVLILRKGEVLVHASLSELRGRVGPSVRLRAAGGPEALKTALEALGRNGLVEESAVRVKVRDVEAEVPELLAALLGRGVRIYEAERHEATLEDLFVEIVEGRAHAQP